MRNPFMSLDIQFILEKQCTGIKFICINFNGLIVLEIRHGLCTTFILENVITVS